MTVANLLFPRRCICCGKVGSYLCKRCVVRVPFARSICPMCKKSSIDGFCHHSCRRPYGLDGVVNIWEYRGIIRSTIVALKFRYVSDVAMELAGHLVKALNIADKPVPVSALLVPVPLHKKRLNSRGFNQSAIIGEQVAKKLGWTYVEDLVVKRKNTVAQTSVQRKEKREKNVLGAFSLNKKYKSKLVEYDKSIFVFDDVWTTGATLREVGKVLKRNGAKNVWGMTVAH